MVVVVVVVVVVASTYISHKSFHLDLRLSFVLLNRVKPCILLVKQLSIIATMQSLKYKNKWQDMEYLCELRRIQ